MAVAQKQLDSPVFRSYRPPDELPMIRQPDAVYEMTQAFLVARKASAGDPLAQHELGVRYLWGRGVEADTMRAAYWIAKAAEQSLGSARYNLGILTYNGWGVAWNPFEAYRQFRRCAELGYPEAQYVVAYFFRENLVVPKNDKEALEWMRKSAEGGYDQAREALPEFAAAAGEGIQDTVREGSMVLLPGMSDTTSRMSDKVLLSNALEAAGPELQKALGMASLIDRHSSVDSARLAAVGDGGECRESGGAGPVGARAPGFRQGGGRLLLRSRAEAGITAGREALVPHAGGEGVHHCPSHACRG